jgi:CheY-like chemotaxis protein
MKRFLLGDIKTIEDIHTTCRTALEAYKILDKQWFDVYIFDHDLGETQPGTSGYDVLKWLLEQGFINPNAGIFLIASNPVGRKNMEELLKSCNYYKRGIEWIRD